jgi:hypothetical protein
MELVLVLQAGLVGLLEDLQEQQVALDQERLFEEDEEEICQQTMEQPSRALPP